LAEAGNRITTIIEAAQPVRHPADELAAFSEQPLVTTEDGARRKGFVTMELPS
jgi:hypothetical protein